MYNTCPFIKGSIPFISYEISFNRDTSHFDVEVIRELKEKGLETIT